MDDRALLYLVLVVSILSLVVSLMVLTEVRTKAEIPPDNAISTSVNGQITDSVTQSAPTTVNGQITDSVT